MYVKIQITGTIELITGMHIGGNSGFSAIGAVDSPIIKDVRTNNPMIPGSSLKGKMRSLLAKKYNEAVVEPDNDDERIINLFGSARKDHIEPSRVLFSDMILENWEDLKKQGVSSRTEGKFENSIKRTTAVANPRQIERAIRGSKFPLDIIYEVKEIENIKKDMTLLKEGFELLQYDYIGGSGSRGYGKVKFYDLQADVVVGDLEESIIEECNRILMEV